MKSIASVWHLQGAARCLNSFYDGILSQGVKAITGASRRVWVMRPLYREEAIPHLYRKKANPTPIQEEPIPHLYRYRKNQSHMYKEESILSNPTCIQGGSSNPSYLAIGRVYREKHFLTSYHYRESLLSR